MAGFIYIALYHGYRLQGVWMFHILMRYRCQSPTLKPALDKGTFSKPLLGESEEEMGAHLLQAFGWTAGNGRQEQQCNIQGSGEIHLKKIISYFYH